MLLRSGLLLLLAACFSCTSAPERIAPVLASRLAWPTFGTITQGFYGDASTASQAPGYYYDESNQRRHRLSLTPCHRGIDLGAPEKTVVWAAYDGIAKIYPWDGTSKDYGNHIIIDHGNNVYTLYAHLLRFDVVDGQKVRKNTLIGLVGSTGNSTGPHLHFEVRHDPQPGRLSLPHYVPGKIGDKVLAGQEIPFDY